jgi:hypothetical protein
MVLVSIALVEALQWVHADHRGAPDAEDSGENVSDVVFEMQMEVAHIDAASFRIAIFRTLYED